MSGAITILLIIMLITAGSALAYLTGAAATLFFWASGHWDYIAIMPQRIFGQLNVFAFMAMPLFILVGELMNRGGITRALVDFAMSLMGRLKGGLGYVNVLTSLFFAGISGSAIADAAALSNTLVPAMKERGYTLEYAGAITAAASIIGPVIPPSIIMIFYGVIMGVDVAALFAAGILPGLILTTALMAANFIFAHRYDHPGGRPEDKVAIVPAAKRALPALLLPFIIMAGIIFGWMTPTEAAAVAVFAALIIGFGYRYLRWQDVYHSVGRTVVLSGAIFIMIAASAGISFLASLTQFPLTLTAFVADLGITGTGYLLILTVIFFVMGMFLEVQIALALVAPILVPVAIANGAHPVHLGIMVCLNLSMGLITPPLGGSMMVVSSVTQVGYWRLVRATLPFVIVEAAILLMIVLFPNIALTIPRLLGLL